MRGQSGEPTGIQSPRCFRFGQEGVGSIFAGIVCLLVVHFLPGCGKVGPPIPPEDVGIAAKLEEKRLEEAQISEQPEGDQVPRRPDEKAGPEVMVPPEEDVILPPLRPIGGQ